MPIPTLRRITTTAVYKGNATEIFRRAIEPEEMIAASKGFASFTGMPDYALREGETYKLDVTTLKLFKTKGYEIFMRKVDPEARVFISQEQGGAVKSWTHYMSVVQNGEQAIWTDDVFVDGGWLTPIVARIGLKMYRHRHTSRTPLSIDSAMTDVPDLPQAVFEPIRSERLVLRAVKHSDAQVINDYINDPRIYENVARIAPGQSLVSTTDWISKQAPIRQAGAGFTYAIECDAALIGMISLGAALPSSSAGLGYWIAPEHWGQGYATEAGHVLIDFAKASLGIQTIYSNYFVENPASGRVLEKLGFKDISQGEYFCEGQNKMLPHVELIWQA